MSSRKRRVICSTDTESDSDDKQPTGCENKENKKYGEYPGTPKKVLESQIEEHKTPSNRGTRVLRDRTPSLKSLEAIVIDDSSSNSSPPPQRRRSARKKSPNKKYNAEFITDVQKMTRSAGSRQNVKASTSRSVYCDSSSSSEEEDSKKKYSQIEKPTLFQEEIDVDGKTVYGFRTPKKRDSMQIMAANTPKTPKSVKKDLKRYEEPGSRTPKSITKLSAKDLQQKTPRHVRMKVKQDITKLLHDSSNSDFSPDESDYAASEGLTDKEESSSSSSSSSHSTDESDPLDGPEKSKNYKPASINVSENLKPKTRRKISLNKENEYVPQCEGYFMAHASSKVITSNHTLDRLKNPRLSQDKLLKLLSAMTISSEHEKAISELFEEFNSNYFLKWIHILNEGYNILLYGLGSKRSLMQSFHSELLSGQPSIVVNGFFPSLTIKEILDSITIEILDLPTTSANAHEAVNTIEEELSLIPETHLFLIVHNLDGPMLRNSKSQDIISRLARIPNIHLIASIDHINAPLLWDHSKLSNYNFTWWDVTTMLPYTKETAFENSLLVQNSGELALSSMRNVFQSLTTNGREIYMTIVKHQLKNKGNPNYQGMPFKDLYSGCREAFLVSSDLALRAQLTEFLDHKLVKIKRTADGIEHLNIPISQSLLQQFVEQQD